MPRERRVYVAPEPRSICACGHTGDGPNSQHSDDRFTAGHGKCTVTGCECAQFTWSRWTLAFGLKLDKQRKMHRKEGE